MNKPPQNRPKQIPFEVKLKTARLSANISPFAHQMMQVLGPSAVVAWAAQPQDVKISSSFSVVLLCNFLYDFFVSKRLIRGFFFHLLCPKIQDPLVAPTLWWFFLFLFYNNPLCQAHSVDYITPPPIPLLRVWKPPALCSLFVKFLTRE